MKQLLGAEYTDFYSAYESERFFGLRINPLKAGTKDTSLPFSLDPVPWEETGFYYREEERPGKHPLHEAGAYYIQEPSAMSAVSVLDPKPGNKVLDLCAAPGGKSTQIAGRLMGKGLLVSNEIVRNRAEILSENIERMGVRNCVVLNESPDSLSPRFSGFFDKILVDAPCSGEGMFRKEENAFGEWSPENVLMCAKRQADILDCAAPMLKAGGLMVYSTCTFNPDENERNVASFIKRHPEFEVIESPLARFFSNGRPEWADGEEFLSKTMRLFPHKLKGEGHFVALLGKKGEDAGSVMPVRQVERKKKEDLMQLMSNLKVSEDAAEDLLSDVRIETFGDNIYLTPASFPDLKGFKVMRPGLHAAVRKKDRLEPAHSLAMALRPDEVTDLVDISFSEAEKYIHGETLNCEESKKGWITVFTGGRSLGLGKADRGIVKNHYPKGLRR